jgi:Rv2258c-like winged HTH domain
MQKPDQDKLNSFLDRMIGDLGAMATGPLVVLGDRLGLFKAMRDGEKITARELAERTGTHERLVREWLAAQAAAGYVSFEDADEARFYLDPEQAAVFADEDSPAFMVGAFEVRAASWIDEPKVADAFLSGKGVAWHDHSKCPFRGTERFFRSGYNANLVSSWLPALEGVVDKLRHGAQVADVGCGRGASTILMARAFPKSHFTGFDYHQTLPTTPAKLRRKRAFPATPASRSRRQKAIPENTISSHSSIVFTIWATPLAHRRMCFKH